MATNQSERGTEWIIHGERTVDATRKSKLSIAEVELPDGTRFEQYVLRSPRAAVIAVLDEPAERLLMIWRHRFIMNRWVWELPGGYVDDNEDVAVAAAREVEEETGWRPRRLSLALSFQPNVGVSDAQTDLYIGHGADYLGQPSDINEAQAVAWIPLAEARSRIAAGEIVGAASVIAVLHLLSSVE